MVENIIIYVQINLMHLSFNAYYVIVIKVNKLVSTQEIFTKYLCYLLFVDNTNDELHSSFSNLGINKCKVRCPIN